MNHFFEYAFSIMFAAIWMMVGVNVCSYVVRCLEDLLTMDPGSRFFSLIVTSACYVIVTLSAWHAVRGR